MTTYHPRPRAFWYGTICGLAVGTALAAFAYLTWQLGIWP